MAEGVKKSFRKAVIDKIINCINFTVNPKEEHNKETLSKYIDKINFDKCSYIDKTCTGYESKTEESVEEIYKALSSFAISKNNAKMIYNLACEAVTEETHQAMESLVHNLNTLHSRAGQLRA